MLKETKSTTRESEYEKYIKDRLEYLREQIKNENIGYAEIAELQGLKEHISEKDVELLEWAGVEE